MKGYVIFCKNAYVENTTYENWLFYLKKNKSKLCKILAMINDMCLCPICDKLSLNFTTRSSVYNHLRFWHNWCEVVNYWIENCLMISPDELDKKIHFDQQGNPKNLELMI